MPVILLVESSDPVERELTSALDGGRSQVRVSRTLDEASEAAASDEVAVVVFGPTFAEASLFESVAAFRRALKVPAMMVAERADAGFLRQAMRAGVADVVPTTASDEDLRDAVEAVIESAAEDKSSLRDAEATDSTVVTVFSTKGGVGKTVLSTNIAASLAAQHDRSTVLVDLDLQFGDVGIALGLRPERTIFDAVQAFDRLDSPLLQGMLTPHESGAKALLAPRHPEDAEIVTAGRAAGIICMLKEMFDFVVVDTAPAFNDITLSALDNSDLIFVMTMMDVASVKNTRITVQKLVQLGYSPDIIRLVLNRADSKVFLTVPEVEKAIGASIAIQIPSDLRVPRSVNKGVPVILEEPRSKVARSISQAVDDVLKASKKGDEAGVA